jgi:phosphate transport system protein
MESVHLNKEMTILKADISKMLSLALESFELSLKSIEDSNKEIALKLIQDDDKIDEINRKIEESIYQIIARYNPLAKDLRYAITMIKFSNNLERIGDLSCNIAKRMLEYENFNLKPIINEYIKKMFGITLQMIKDSYRAFGEKNVELAVEVWKKDNEIDDLERKVKANALEKLKSDSTDKEQMIPYILIARSIERIADHATNLCEEIIYIETGKEIKKYL